MTAAELHSEFRQAILAACRDVPGDTVSELLRGLDVVLEAVRAEDMELLSRCFDALSWCSGSPDFNDGGQAAVGWKLVCRPLLNELNERKRAAQQGTK